MTDHGKNGNARERIAQEKTQRSSLGESLSNAQKETSADGAPKSNELDMARFQANTISISPSKPTRILVSTHPRVT